MQKVNLTEKFSKILEFESPKIVGELNGQYVKLSKLKGEFVWHSHENEDELFLVVKGRLRMQLRTGEIILDEGEFFIVPRGVEHNPIADPECHIMLFEPKSTLNTGDAVSDKTVTDLEWI
jgi:mannose-6-phosphate isomerase-like protein (cupin superfamily)